MNNERPRCALRNQRGLVEPVSAVAIAAMVLMMGAVMGFMMWDGHRMMQGGHAQKDEKSHGSSGHEEGHNAKGGMGMMADMCPMMGHAPVVALNPEHLPDTGSEAAGLYARYCSQCHALPSPQMHTAEEWRTAIARMMERMKTVQGMTKSGLHVPSDADARTIMEYLARHARPPAAYE
ncbi:MAG: hypothetical protein HYY13_05675 [Nitrospirae bacterium]|nr:hypothetical protein [Nitrospirota bacterium]